MATAVLAYSAQHYNSLPSIADASRSLKPADIALLTTTIGQVFVKHKVQKLFSIILLHNHFSLDENEILVNYESVAVPWKTPSLANSSATSKAAHDASQSKASFHTNLPTMCPRYPMSVAFSHSFLN